MEEVKKLTPKQLKFCKEYCIDLNATQAAIRTGYSAKTAYSIGWENLRKPEIKEKINELLDECSMGSSEITKRFTDLARTDMSDYVVKKLVPYTPQIKVSLEQFIQSKLEYIRREEEYCRRKGLTEQPYEDFQKHLEYLKDEVIRLEIELEANPNAFRIVDGETIMIEQAELDLVKIVDDKEKGKIKSIKHTKEGVQVEMYAADLALANLSRIRAMFIDKSEVEITDATVKVGYGSEKGD